MITPIRLASVTRWAGHGHGSNRRILYNRASADPQGNPWDPKRQLLKWDGTKWTGWDIPDYSAAPPGSGVGPFIMQQEGMGRLFALDKMAEGPFPEHYEPFETPLGTNPLHQTLSRTRLHVSLKTTPKHWVKPISSRMSEPPIV